MRIRTPITLVALLGILLGGAWYGWASITSEPEEESEAGPQRSEPRCQTTQVYKKGTKIKAKTITVNVYNAGLISGLASETLDNLVAKGFRRGAAENAPTGINATNVTILTDAKNSPQVRLVSRHFRGEVRIIRGNPIDRGVNVIVGDDFRGMDASANRKLVLQKRVTTCTTSAGNARQGQS